MEGGRRTWPLRRARSALQWADIYVLADEATCQIVHFELYPFVAVFERQVLGHIAFVASISRSAGHDPNMPNNLHESSSFRRGSSPTGFEEGKGYL